MSVSAAHDKASVQPLRARSPLSTRVRRVHIANFRSIDAATLHLGDCTALVGTNAAGKSNLVDAIQFLADAVSTGLPDAIGRRDGIQAVRRRTPGKLGKPPDVRIEIELEEAANGGPVSRMLAYGFTIGAVSGGGWKVKDEWTAVNGQIEIDRTATRIRVPGGITAPFGRPPDDQLVLTLGLPGPGARALHTALRRIKTYSIVPEMVRPPQPFIEGAILLRSGHNLYQVWGRLESKAPHVVDRIKQLFGQVVPGITEIKFAPVGRYATLHVDFECGRQETFQVDGSGLSDGALRALGILVACFQPGQRVLTAIEEPEISIHPHAVEKLLEAVLSARSAGQVLFTTHSTTFLDSSSVHPEMLRVVEWADGTTRIGPIAPGQIEEMRSRLVTGAELLAEGALRGVVDPAYSQRIRPRR